MHISVKTIIGGLWGVAGLVWLVGALTAKRTARTQSAASRLLQLVLGGATIGIGFTRWFAFDPLTRTFVPNLPVVTYAGIVLTLAGIGLAIWARVLLGGNWSSAVTVKQDHSLVRRGPYAVVRHPIYSSFLLALVGTAVTFREVRALLAVGIAFLMFCIKLRIEERFMTEEFGADYREYQRQVKALIPFVY